MGGARVFGDINDKNSDVYKLMSNFSTTVLKESEGTKPQTFYINLDSKLEELFSTTQSLDDMVKTEEGFEKEWQKARMEAHNHG